MVLSIDNISKSYGRVQALKGLSLQVPEGSIYGVLGPNGSGKTTLLGILLGILKPDSGGFSWFGGMQAEAARKQMGALLETSNFYPYLSAEENLEINARIKGASDEDIARVLDVVGLASRKQDDFRHYSLGMKQRLAIGNALLGSPSVLVLDEPTNGLDPQGIAEIRELILDLNRRGMTIIMASHLLDEVEKVCTHVAILKQGDLLIAGRVESLFAHEFCLEIRTADMSALHQALSGYAGLREPKRRGDNLLLYADQAIDPEAVNRYCFEHGLVLTHLNKQKTSLESRFMHLTS